MKLDQLILNGINEVNRAVKMLHRSIEIVIEFNSD